MDDLISRQAAIDAVEFGITHAKAIDIETGKVTDLFATTNKELEKAINRLAQLPSAERLGRWIHYAHRDPQYDISGVKTWGEEYQCSNCGWIHSVIEDFGHYAYCPNCGAKIEV